MAKQAKQTWAAMWPMGSSEAESTRVGNGLIVGGRQALKGRTTGVIILPEFFFILFMWDCTARAPFPKFKTVNVMSFI